MADVSFPKENKDQINNHYRLGEELGRYVIIRWAQGVGKARQATSVAFADLLTLTQGVALCVSAL